MKRHLLGSLAVVLLVAACASRADDASSSASAIHGGTVCDPLDYPHVMSNAEYYRQFATDADAADYLTKLLAQGQLAGNSGPDATLKEITQDARLVRLVGEVYEGFRKVFPDFVVGLPTPPRVAIVNSSIKNAFALGPGFREDASHRADQSPWLFIVHTALMNTGASDTELRGLFAHEIGHLILRSYLPEVRQAIRTTYLVGQTEDGLIGETQTDEGPLADHVEEMLKRQARVGGVPELGLPVAAGLGAIYPKITDSMLARASAGEAAGAAPCAAAKAKETELLNAQAAMLPDQAGGNFVPRTPTAEESAHLDQLSAALTAALKTCLDPVTTGANSLSLMALTASTNQLSEESLQTSSPDHAKLRGLMLDAEKLADSELPNAPLIDRMLQAQAPIRSELIALRNVTQYPIDQIRVYDFEEDADDASVRILRAIGDDPTGLAKFLTGSRMSPDPAAA